MNADMKVSNGLISINIKRKTVTMDNVINKETVMPIISFGPDTVYHGYKFILVDSSGNNCIVHITRTGVAFVYGNKIYLLKMHPYNQVVNNNKSAFAK
ncbi:MAG: hypothetical protein ACREHG_08530, partial [Candidatus Saccharimonadales bacterium]